MTAKLFFLYKNSFHSEKDTYICIVNSKQIDILERASLVFMKLGIRSVTMNDIATQLGISKKTLYNHFKDKNHLVEQIIRTKIEEDIVVFKKASSEAVNAIDEAITLSTIRPFEPVAPGQLLATVKIIPFAVSETTLALCEDAAASCNGLFRVAPYKKCIVGLLQTVLPGHREVLIAKGTEATAARLAAMGLSVDIDRVCEHREPSIRTSLKELMEQGCDLALILGASAVADRRDVVPSAIASLGGEILQLGMPVDPGNLSFLGKINEMQLVGLPGSARSPRLHGSDWIIQRLVAGMAITIEDIRNMGVGGLLKEIPSRPMPRTEASPPRTEVTNAPPKVAAIVLAAGQSRRMGRQNKLLAKIDGIAMIARTVDAVLASAVESVTVVLGHEADRVRESLSSRNVTFVRNPDYAEGLSTSLKRGLASLPSSTDAALICLGDMPRISAAEIDHLIASYAPNQGHAICVPTHNGKRGNPVLVGRRFFAEIQARLADIEHHPSTCW